MLSIGDHGGVEGVGWSRGQGEKALELQPSEEGGVSCCEGSGCVAAWTTSGQHEAEPLRGRGEPWILPSHGFSRVYRNEEMAKHGYTNWHV